MELFEKLLLSTVLLYLFEDDKDIELFTPIR